MRENVMDAGSGMRVYPGPAEVFVAEQVDLVRHLHPLISIELAEVNPAWHGWIHLLSPLEPATGLLGEHTGAFHAALQCENWIGFAMEGDLYRMLGDVRYFARATTPEELPDPDAGFRVDLDDHCAAQERSYRARRDAFRRAGQGRLVTDDDHYGVSFNTLLEQLGGPAVEGGNWETLGLFPTEREDGDFGEDGDAGQVWPISPAGNRFHFVAAVPGYHYRESGADWILLFFEPVERLALLTFDWS